MTVAMLTFAGMPTAAQVAGSIAQVSAGSHFTCALTSEGGVYCWGYNGHGRLGDGTTTDRSSPVGVSGLTSGVAFVSAGGPHACALTTGGGVKCWGYNGYGGLGDGTTTNSPIPVDVSGLASGMVTVSAGHDHTCALTTGGGVKCWGSNSVGQLGDGTTADSPVPVDVSGLTGGVAAIAAGTSHTCALMTGGGVKCWGMNNSGELGDGSTTSSSTPVDASGHTSGVAEISAGDHTCALNTEGGVECWGPNGHGELGAMDGAAGISLGIAHTCALTTEGGVKCWGFNNHGQLGDGTTTSTGTPVAVSGLASGVTNVSAGGFHTCALTTDSLVKCWGSNEFGQLGDGTTTDSTTPVNVASSLSALTTGTGNGTISSQPTGIDCGSTCQASFNYGSAITLTATPDASSIFAGWSGDCAGTGTCQVTMNGAKSVTATFALGALRPDGLLRGPGSPTYVGNDVFNTTGAHQTRTAKARRGSKVVFYAKFQNDGEVADAFAIKGPGKLGNFVVRYLAGATGSTRITSSVVAGTYTTTSVSPSRFRVIRLVVLVPSGATVGTLKTWRVTATSSSDGTKRDSVKARVRVTRR